MFSALFYQTGCFVKISFFFFSAGKEQFMTFTALVSSTSTVILWALTAFFYGFFFNIFYIISAAVTLDVSLWRLFPFSIKLISATFFICCFHGDHTDFTANIHEQTVKQDLVIFVRIVITRRCFSMTISCFLNMTCFLDLKLKKGESEIALTFFIWWRWTLSLT